MVAKKLKKEAAENADVKPKRAKKPKEKQERNGGWNDSATMNRVLKTVEEHSPYRAKPPAKKYTVYSDDKIDRNDLALFLRQNLKLEIIGGGFTDPNNREVRIFLGDDLLTSAQFDVVQQREYEG